MIAADGLGRSFGGRPVVSGVTLRIEEAEVVGLVGPNGAGKTTTIRMLLGLLRPSSGTAHIDEPAGYMPELYSGYDGLSVRGYLRFCARMKGYGLETIHDALASTDIADLSRRPMARLSKGQRQRVGIAQAVLGTPRTLILDEPTIGLDPRQVVEARALVRSIADDGCAVLLSTHLLAEAASLCDRVLVMAGGKVVAEETDLDAGDLETRFIQHLVEAERG